LQVGDDASAVLYTIRFEKISTGFKRNSPKPQRLNELTDPDPSPNIIVDNCYQRFFKHFAVYHRGTMVRHARRCISALRPVDNFSALGQHWARYASLVVAARLRFVLPG
jgi:hypothetical protein